MLSMELVSFGPRCSYCLPFRFTSAHFATGEAHTGGQLESFNFFDSILRLGG